jgi:hypothetical protein
MAIERWTDERLDKLASTVSELSTSVTEVRITSEALLQTTIIHQQGLETSQKNFEALVAEIRGLRTGNRRILDYLFGEQNNNE